MKARLLLAVCVLCFVLCICSCQDNNKEPDLKNTGTAPESNTSNISQNNDSNQSENVSGGDTNSDSGMKVNNKNKKSMDDNPLSRVDGKATPSPETSPKP